MSHSSKMTLTKFWLGWHHRDSPQTTQKLNCYLSHAHRTRSHSEFESPSMDTPCCSVKYLGVLISSNLNWSNHIESVCKKANRHLGFVNRQFKNSPPHIHALLYRTAVLPKLEYCGSVWDPHLASDVTSLEKIQKFAARIVTRK